MFATLGILFYLFPTIVAFILRRAVPDMRIGYILAANLLLGWTGIGWFGVLIYVVYRVLRNASQLRAVAPATRPDWVPAPVPLWDPPSARRKCECTNGRMRCPSCLERRGEYINNVWHQCTYCLGAGTVQCTHCDGSGYLNF